MHLEIVTPMGAKVTAEISQVTAPGSLGDLGILPGHRPLTTSLGIGLLSYTDEGDGALHWLAVNGGFLQVADGSVIVVTETAETPEELDVKRAEAAAKRAQERIRSVDSTDAPEKLRFAIDALHRAENRVRASKLAKKALLP
jgi:F-type H+-transporting ATPase subunit epsilon